MTSSGEYLKRLAEIGVRPEQVDYVMTTHFHTDHVGWNTRWENGRWVPTFPNARYVMSEKEWTYWSALHKETPQNQIADSVIPIVEAGRAQMVKNDFAIDDEISFESTAGHTPDHMSVHIASRGQHAVITGDLIHSPVQCLETDWVPRPDFDAKQAAARLPGALLRARRARVHLALPLALLRPRGAGGQRLLVRVREELSGRS
jgi:glyoxylase-like metal-dependent hydrolase (beta-lactamase superfamily II)